MSLYNRTALEPFTRANADDVNNETAKIKAAMDQIEAMITSLQEGGGAGGDGIARYTWIAFADSGDGTVNFSHEPGNRAYLGLATNKLLQTPSDFPEDYTWALIRGSDAPTLRLVANQPRFDFDASGNAIGASEVLFTAEGTNLATTIAFAAQNDDGNDVTLTTVNATQVKLDIDDFGDASWVRVVASANGGAVSDSVTITATRQTRPLVNKGRWRTTVAYQLNEVVFFRGHSFVSLADSNTGHQPDARGEDNAWWQVLARGGDVGDPSAPDAAFAPAAINLTSSSTGVNLRTIANAAGYRGKADATLTFNVPSGVVITGKDGGGIGIDTGEWPDDVYTISITLVVQSGGVVRGGGGDGGKGWGRGPARLLGSLGNTDRRGKGGDGGDAIYCRVPMTVNIDAGGKVEAGGGGGDGAATRVTGWPLSSYSNSGGGGGGFPNGKGGSGIGPGTDALDGTVAGGGLGGANGGANGGNAGAAASPGGAAGFAVRKNGNTVTVTNSGTMTGTAS